MSGPAPSPGLFPFAAPDEQLRVLLRGSAEVVPQEELADKLVHSARDGRPLRVKLGLDPTAADVTLGWAVVLRTLRRFQDLGHTAVLIVGDFTARVGDPSGKTETRPQLSADAVRGYASRLLGQFGKILSAERLEIRYNAEWLEALDMEGVLKLTASYTVARMLERDDFAKRYAQGRPISMMEFMYPLLQGYDSVAVQADVELGGTDQLFNLLVGRELQRDHGQEPQVVFTMPLLEGLDGVQKMSQSLGNYVGITEPADEMFGKLMSIPDGLISRYLALCTDLDEQQVRGIDEGLATGALHPGQEKRRMAREIVQLYHGADAGTEAETRFDVVHKQHEIPDDVAEVPLPADAVRNGRVWIPRLLVSLGLVGSNAEGRRQIVQGAVRLDGETVTDPDGEVDVTSLTGSVVQVGRRRFVRIGAGPALPRDPAG